MVKIWEKNNTVKITDFWGNLHIEVSPSSSTMSPLIEPTVGFFSAYATSIRLIQRGFDRLLRIINKLY
jgi:hypothetical protein